MSNHKTNFPTLSDKPVILVVGGAGYIGSQTVWEMLDKFKVVILDNMIYGHESVIPKNCPLEKADLLKPLEIDQVFEKYKFDGVIHFAAFTYVGESSQNPEKYFYNNVVGSLNLLASMRKYAVKNIVFSSTCATYGMPEKLPLNENCPQNPINPYGETKLMVEKILKNYALSYGFKAYALRYFNAAGADLEGKTGEWHEPETHLIPLIISAGLGKLPNINIFGDDYPTPDGTCIRDYIHTKDLALAHILALEKLLKLKDGFIDYINLGSSIGYSVKEIIKAVENHLKVKIKTNISPRRPGDPEILLADITKAKQELGWEPKFSDLETIINSAIKWHIKQTK